MSCLAGFYLNSGRVCIACANLPSNCISCDAVTSCTQCKDGFYLSGTTCIACSANFLSCNSANFCTRAAAGYYIQRGLRHKLTGVVVACTSPCATCIVNGNFCRSCTTGFTLNGTQCVNDRKV